MQTQQNAYISAVKESYQPKGAYIYLGSGILQGQVLADAQVKLALKMMNRHGLVAGATGTGKTRTLQLIAEQLSDQGVPVFMLDVKGDLSGLAQAGEIMPALTERAQLLDYSFNPQSFPVELFSLSGELGAAMRIRVSDFGPVLLARILGLNDTQTGVLAALFKYAADQKMDLINMADLKALLDYLSSGPGAEAIKQEYGRISSSTAGAILRKIVALEQQGLGHIFGETAFETDDLFRVKDDKGVISLLNISDVQNQPVLFSTFLLSLLSRLFHQLPEVGNPDKPKLVFFFDEAHLLFKDAPKAFLSKVDQIIRLIRSKGVGVFFCTQAPTDIPENVLAQLGNRVQHALRAFTPNDAEDLRKTVKTYPRSEFYKIDEVLTQLGTGQALITVLNDKGIPTEVVATHLVPPRAVMGPLESTRYNSLVSESPLYAKYKDVTDPYSAEEIVEEKRRIDDTASEEGKSRKKTKRRTSTRQTPMEAATKAVTTTLARKIANAAGQILVGILTGMFKKRKR